jgi:hypothetical protein
VGALRAQTPTTASQPQDCGPFVQQFYNWYVAKENALMKRNSRESALEVTLREKRSSFSPELVKGLKEDPPGLCDRRLHEKEPEQLQS